MKIINDNATYCRLAQFIGNRRELNEDKLEKLEELTMDGAKAKAILDASRSSMGQYRAPRPAPSGVLRQPGTCTGSHCCFQAWTSLPLT